MDTQSQLLLAHLLRTKPTAAIGTIFRDAPNVSQVLYAPAANFSTIFIHISNLARHTRSIQQNPRVSLMVSEAYEPTRDPQTLARVTIQGTAVLVPSDAADPAARAAYDAAHATYLARFPQAEFNFQLGGFELYGITIESGRFVAGFGKTFNLTPQDFVAASAIA